MNRARDVLNAKINILVSFAFILSCGLFYLVMGFRITHMPNPLTGAIDPAYDQSADY